MPQSLHSESQFSKVHEMLQKSKFLLYILYSFFHSYKCKNMNMNISYSYLSFIFVIYFTFMLHVLLYIYCIFIYMYLIYFLIWLYDSIFTLFDFKFV